MVKSLDKVPYNERRWGYRLARNVINTNENWALVFQKRQKPLSEENWQKKLPEGGGYLGSVLLGMCRWPLRVPAPL